MAARPPAALAELSLSSREAIAARCVQLRQAFASNQAEFCRLVGLAQNTWNQFERGTNRPSLDVALQLRRATGLSLDWLYCGDVAGLSRTLTLALLEHAPRA